MIRVRATDLRVANFRRRMTFHFGNVHVTEGPQIICSLTCEIGDTVETGLSMGALAPMWFYKDPDMSLEAGVSEMIHVIEMACSEARRTARATPFEFWLSVYHALEDRPEATHYPGLLRSYGVSLVEQALLDAYCRARDVTFAHAVRENRLGIELGAIYEELSGTDPAAALPSIPQRRMAVRHTVGLGDPLTEGDIPPADRLDDGLPQSLEAYIRQDGIDHFKIKLSATDRDADRLVRVSRVLDRHLDSYLVTLDANEQYESIHTFRDRWETLASDPALDTFLGNVAYVEQPLPRDRSFESETARVLSTWTDRPPLVIDESDDALGSLATALDCGYAGTSHKNCKGVFKGIANRCLLEHRRRSADRELLMSGEDLTTLGPIELQQDLAVMATLGLEHVERNGHHYYRGLDMIPDAMQDAVLEAHDDLFRRHEDGFVTMAIDAGRIRLDSVVDAPFGRANGVDPSTFMPVDDWSVESIQG